MNGINNIFSRKRKNLTDKSEDGRIKEQQPSQSIEKQNLEEARYQAEQAFQRGGLDREQAYGLHGLDKDGNWLKM